MMRELHNAVCDTIPFVMNEKTGKPAWRIDGCDGPVADVSKDADEGLVCPKGEPSAGTKGHEGAMRPRFTSPRLVPTLRDANHIL